jgi:hypothetical protein
MDGVFAYPDWLYLNKGHGDKTKKFGKTIEQVV